MMYRISKNYPSSLNIYLTKIIRHTEMKLVPLEGELQTLFVGCGRSNVTPTMATRSATIDMAANGDSTQESILFTAVPSHKICDH
jgi:hypothetical protein